MDSVFGYHTEKGDFHTSSGPGGCPYGQWVFTEFRVTAVGRGDTAALLLHGSHISESDALLRGPWLAGRVEGSGLTLIFRRPRHLKELTLNPQTGLMGLSVVAATNCDVTLFLGVRVLPSLRGPLGCSFCSGHGRLETDGDS